MRPYRLRATDCVVNKAFCYNERFKAVAGREFFVGGEIRFTASDPTNRQGVADGTYRSCFGPIFSNPGVIYANTNDNLRLAFRRLTACRADSLAIEIALRRMQYDYVNRNSHLYHALRRALSDRTRCDPEHLNPVAAVEGAPVAFFAADAEFQRVYCDRPHPKKKLRQANWVDEYERGRHRGRLGLSSVLVKLKRDEVAKPGKYGRCIGDLGIAAAARGAPQMEALKTRLAAEDFVYDGVRFRFVKSPDEEALTDTFKMLMDPPREERAFYVYFSDDACYSYRDSSDTVVCGNLDISSCDTSHTGAIFDALLASTPGELASGIQVLIDQCRLPAMVKSTDGTQKVLLAHDEPILFSGSTVTTFINNIANVTIGHAIFAGSTPPKNVGEIVRRASRAGYLVTCTPARRPEHLQFLKHSPVLDEDGNWRPLLNIGVALRAVGTCHGDLPGRGDIQRRAEAFNAALIRGAYPCVTNPFIAQLAGSTENPKLDSELSRKTHSGVMKITDEALFARYLDVGPELPTLTEAHIAELNHYMRYAKPGFAISTTLSQRVLHLDYGLEPTERASDTPSW